MSGPIEAEAIALGALDLTDVDALIALVNRAYRGAGGWNSEAGLIDGKRITIPDLMADALAHPKAELLIYREQGALLACVRLDPRRGRAWNLGMFAVDPDCQARGLGRQMLAAAEAHVLAKGGRRIVMGVVNVRDTLIAWYERRGYRRTGESEPFPYGDDSFGRPLRDDFCFVVLEKRL